MLLALHQESKRRTYIIRLEVLEHSRHLLKARLYIAPDLFVQVYRNDRYDQGQTARGGGQAV